MIHVRSAHFALALTLLAASALNAQAQEKWGTIKGRITWGGDKVSPKAVIKLPDVPGAAGCLDANNGKLPPDQTWVVNPKNKGFKNVFVWLADADKKPLPIHPNLKDVKVKQVEIDQPACHFIPHCLALREGQTLIVKNSAPFAHSFKYDGSEPQNQGSILVPSAGEVKIKLVADRRPIPVSCTVHSWMRGYVRVFNHPYFALTDADGAFEIKDAPVGKYRLMIWQGNEGWKGGAKGGNGDPVEITAGPVVDLGTIEFPPTKEE